MRYWKPMPPKGNPKVGIAVAAYLPRPEAREAAALECLVASLRAQTYPNWAAEVTHDGPYPHDHAALTFFDQWDAEPRVTVVEAAERKQQFGHPHRPAALQRLLDAGCDWVGLTNQDNYYAPVYLEWMLSEAQARNAELAYCDCVHSHKKWKPLACEVARGRIDLGGFLVRADLAAKIKFDKTTFAADWDWVSRLRKAAKKVAKVPGTLFVHN